MEIYSDKADGVKVFKLKDASTTIEEVPTPVATSSLDEASCQKLLGFSAPKVSLARTGIKSMHMEQMLLLGKMDARRLMENPEPKCNYCAHECDHCGILIKSSWKVKGSHKNKGGGGGIHHTACTGRHLENRSSEAGRNHIKESSLEKISKRIKY